MIEDSVYVPASERLQCNCGNDAFVIALRVHGNGQPEAADHPPRYRCLVCGNTWQLRDGRGDNPPNAEAVERSWRWEQV